MSHELHVTKNKVSQKFAVFILLLNTFFGQYWAKGKLTKLYFYEKGERVQLSFWPILFLMGYIYQGIRNNIVAKKIELILHFHKTITKLVFHWPNM